MRRILLAEDTSLVQPEIRGKTLCVYHKAYDPPLGPWHSIEFSRFKDRPRDFLHNIKSLIFVGLNRAITPGNRTEMVWEVLFNKIGNLHKISVDRTLFISEPWRAWFHFGFVDARYREYTYSYIAESQHNAFIDGMRDDDPFSLDELIKWSIGVVRCHYPKWFNVSFRTIETSDSDKDAYAKLKQSCFEGQRTIKWILRQLSDFAESTCDERMIPAPHLFFRSRVHEIVGTDLPVDQWLMRRLKEMAETINGIAGVCYDNG